MRRPMRSIADSPPARAWGLVRRRQISRGIPCQMRSTCGCASGSRSAASCRASGFGRSSGGGPAASVSRAGSKTAREASWRRSRGRLWTWPRSSTGLPPQCRRWPWWSESRRRKSHRVTNRRSRFARAVSSPAGARRCRPTSRPAGRASPRCSILTTAATAIPSPTAPTAARDTRSSRGFPMTVTPPRCGRSPCARSARRSITPPRAGGFTPSPTPVRRAGRPSGFP